MFKTEYKNEDEAIAEIPGLFESLSVGYLIILLKQTAESIIQVDKTITCETFSELNKTLAHLPGNVRNFSFVKDKQNEIITFNGNSKVASFRVQNQKPYLHFFKDRTQHSRTITNTKEVKSAVLSISRHLRQDFQEHKPGALTLVLCAPRIEDTTNDSEVAKLIKDVAYPIVLSAGSQVILRRDSGYQFGDGSNASSAEPVVLLTCEN